MEWSNLRHRQINEMMAMVVAQFEICVTMTWFAGRTAHPSVNFRHPTLNLQHPATIRATAISLCAPRCQEAS
jgi:hypothetical protein